MSNYGVCKLYIIHLNIFSVVSKASLGGGDGKISCIFACRGRVLNPGFGGLINAIIYAYSWGGRIGGELKNGHASNLVTFWGKKVKKLVVLKTLSENLLATI